MKQILSFTFFAGLLLFFYNCSKQEQALNLTETDPSAVHQFRTDASDQEGEERDTIILAYTPSDASFKSDSMDGDGEGNGKKYCVYQILAIAGPRKYALSTNAIVCPDCPAPPSCKGSFSGSPFKIYDDQGLASFGTLVLLNPSPDRSCRDCEDGGITGYDLL